MEDLREEALGALAAGVGEELVRTADLDDAAVGHEHDVVGGRAGETRLMGDHDHRHPVAGELTHDLQDLVDHLGVERGGGLVEQHRLALHGEGPGDGDTLLPAAGELGGILVRPVARTGPVEEFTGALVGVLPLAPADADPARRDDLQDRPAGEEVKDWKTMPTSARSRASPLPSSGSGCPSSGIAPDWMVSSRLTARHSADFPEPDGPMTTTTSPLATVRLVSRSTCGSPKYLLTSRSSISGSPAMPSPSHFQLCSGGRKLSGQEWT